MNYSVRAYRECPAELINYFRMCSSVEDKRKNWFGYLLRDYDKYSLWTTVFGENEKIVAFSCVQKHFFPENYARVLTRTYFDNSIRKNSLITERYIHDSPAMLMLSEHMQFLKETKLAKYAIITMEQHISEKNFNRLLSMFKTGLNLNFEIQSEKIQTYPDQSPEDFHTYALVPV